MRIEKFRCFGIDAKYGNLAFVVFDSNLSANQKQEYAKVANIPVCVFVDKIEQEEAFVDFYYPHRQSPLCLHGSLAMAKALFMHNKNYKHISIISSTFKKVIATTDDSKNERISLKMPIERISDVNMPRELIANLLNIESDALGNINLASVGSPKLLVEIINKKVLLSLQPQLKAITEWGKVNMINGIYAYSLDQSGVYARNFNHLTPNLEDSATGVGAGALTVYLKSSLIVHQGINLANPCKIYTQYNANSVSISGNVFALN